MFQTEEKIRAQVAKAFSLLTLGQGCTWAGLTLLCLSEVFQGQPQNDMLGSKLSGIRITIFF